MWRISRPDALAVLEDELAKKSLGRYFSVLQNEKTAKFIIAKKLSAEFDDSDSLEKLWAKHAKCTDEFRDFEREVDEDKNSNLIPSPAKSYFDLKIPRPICYEIHI
jgi:putative pyruvate formate lyase activating enzyme